MIVAEINPQQKDKMSYLVDFERAIETHDAPSIMRLWEEYTSSDEVDAEDFCAILEAVKTSELRDYIGRHIERAIPLWKTVEEGTASENLLRLIIDLQMSNNDELYDLTLAFLEKKFGDDKYFAEKMRLIGMRGRKEHFQGALSNYILLNHMKPGNFVFHTAGWGVGEIVDVSMLREQLRAEFDYVPGIKEVSFYVAFSTLIPITKDHFLARRFGDPDALETDAKKDPIGIIRLLLKDLGPKTAAEIKEELSELVIPEDEWNRWWQSARAKIKKDRGIESPTSLKLPFRLLKQEVSHEEKLLVELEKKPETTAFIQQVYTHLKDFPETLRNNEFKESLIGKLKELLSFQETSLVQQLQIHFFLQDLLSEKNYPPIPEIIKKAEDIEALIDEVPIQSFKKRALSELKACHEDWAAHFLSFLFLAEQAPLRDYLLTELMDSNRKEKCTEKLEELLLEPDSHPEFFVWFFQKAMTRPNLPFGDKAGRPKLFESLLILLSRIERDPNRRDLVKKIHALLTNDRYKLVRDIMKNADEAFVKEFLLLVTKCHSLSEHDIQIFHSLAEVAHPSLKSAISREALERDEDVIWTTHEGYTSLQKKIEHIGTVETVDNAKEIEVARSHGDLRENAEFKAALERRDRLQSELKMLSEQINKARILVKQEIDTSQVSVGTIVECEKTNGSNVSYTLLGPWDADPDKNILSFQSKLAKDLLGKKTGDQVELAGETLTITRIVSAL